MEKVEVSKREIQLPGKRKKISLVHYEWRFTETEKSEIRRALRHEAPKEKIEAFIRYLEFVCIAKKALLEQSKKRDVRETRERVLIDCKAALNHLRKIERGKVTLWHDDTIDYFGLCKGFLKSAEAEVEKDPFSDFIVETLDKAWEAVGPLDKFIKVLEAYHQAEDKKVGRKKADSDHFIRTIRNVYIEYIGKPTTYEKGAFFTVVQIIHEIFDLPFADPSRSIKAALKK